ncbi:TetR family transcriptional regulator [Hoyosella rhizosphaerae]|uniref:TetR family transcriptional regulator n=1 Tax=Hoyosella rhizosphaerae TaxID=1755582 RepID=A0A916XHB9_9ACTN|nr:TetR family transcriptional regulator [Hoyosella rhizosphaerae]MBN4928246.1 TetR family transcriptional regulator [Hoyosella rhizosphaerae]GGC73525.1 TetR family transcriptional regulator [Hoyosella rhizosphaerae]
MAPKQAKSKPSYAEQAKSLLVDVILDSADSMIRKIGWSQTRMEAIAKASGVSKPTLYRAFGTREQLASAYLDRETDRLADTVRESLSRTSSLDSVATTRVMLVTALDSLRDNPLVAAVLADDDSSAGLLPLLTVHGDRLLERATDRIIPLVEEWFPDVDAVLRRRFVDSVIRLLLSHSILPGASPDETVDTVMTMIEPFIEKHF